MADDITKAHKELVEVIDTLASKHYSIDEMIEKLKNVAREINPSPQFRYGIIDFSKPKPEFEEVGRSYN